MKKFEQYNKDTRSDEEYEKDFIEETHMDELRIDFNFIDKPKLLFYRYQNYYDDLIFTHSKHNNFFQINIELIKCSSFRYDLVQKILMKELDIFDNIDIL